MTTPTMRAIRLHEHGGPDVLRYEQVPLPQPGPGEALVRVHAVGVNPPTGTCATACPTCRSTYGRSSACP